KTQKNINSLKIKSLMFFLISGTTFVIDIAT
ncbi:MAG: hypothetical protein ACI9N3_003100, partial [Colwellia sp.]